MMRVVRPYCDEKTMKDFYYAYFYPSLWDKNLGPCFSNRPRKSYSSAKACLRIILKKNHCDHISSHLRTIPIMPLVMLFEYCSLELFLKKHLLMISLKL